MAKLQSYEDYVTQQSTDYATQNYTGYDASTGRTDPVMTRSDQPSYEPQYEYQPASSQPSYEPAPTDQPTYTDPYSSGDAYSTGTGYAQQQAWQPAPESEYRYSAPTPAAPSSSYQPVSSDPYQTGTAYSTGADAPFGEYNPWRPRRLEPPTAPALIRADNERAGLENAAYDAWQYGLGNVHSTDQSRGGLNAFGAPVLMNPLAWNPYLAQQAGAPEPVAPVGAEDSAAARRQWQTATSRPDDGALVRPDGTLTEHAFSDEEYLRLTGHVRLTDNTEFRDTSIPWPAIYDQRHPVIAWRPWHRDPSAWGRVPDWFPDDRNPVAWGDANNWLPFLRKKKRPVW